MKKKLGIILISIALIVSALLAYTMIFRHSEDNSNGHVHNNEAIYTCPMHPEIRQNKPGNCPICGMKLVLVTDENSATQSNKEVQDKMNLNISPYQASLVGIKPIEVQKRSVSHSIPVSGRIMSRSAVALQVFERDLRYIKPGVDFSGSSEVFPEDVIKGKVTSIDNMADPSSRTIRVIGRIIDGGRNSLSEASFTGQIAFNLGEKLVVPEKSVLFTGLGAFIYLYEKETLRPKKVILGPKVGEEYVILGGVSQGDLISSGPNFLIDSESKIRGLSTSESTPICPDGQKWNTPMAMCMPSDSL